MRFETVEGGAGGPSVPERRAVTERSRLHGPSMPMFSVIMPVFNHAEYVREAIRSVQDQSCGDWELIVIDDGSTDGSDGIVKDISAGDERIIAMFLQRNSGPSAARNAGLKRSRGRWLTYLDSDDVWFPDALANYADYISAHPETEFIHGYRHRLNMDGSITELDGYFQDRPSGTAELFERAFLSHLCVCYRRELIEKAGPYDENLRGCEDYDLYLRMSLHCRFDPLGLPTGLRRRHATNISRQTGFSRSVEAEVLQRFVERQGGRGVLSPEAITRRLGRLYYAAGRQYFRQRCFRQSAEAIERANRYRRTFKGVAIGFLASRLGGLGRSDGKTLPKI